MKSLFSRRSPASAASAVRETRSDLNHEVKSTAPLVAVELSRLASFTHPDFTSLCQEGFTRNPVVYRCVRTIAESAASVPLKGNDLPIDSLDALERFYAFLQVGGCAYLKAIRLDDSLISLQALRPDRVTPVHNRQGRLSGFNIDNGQQTEFKAYDPLTGQCDIMAMALFNPLDEGGGQSPLRAAATSIDLHNQGTKWAKSLLDNSARPSGALVYQGHGGDRLSRDQIERLKSELEEGFTGPARAGRPMVLEGGLDWKTMGLSPSDMDFTEGRREAARDIALAFGVPPMLLGIPGDNTYANYAEANRAFWRQTVIPLVTRTARKLSHWLSSFEEEGLTFAPDLDAVPALASEQSALWSRLEAASFLSVEERRKIAGLSVGEDGA